jgi:hypothetical protein
MPARLAVRWALLALAGGPVAAGGGEAGKAADVASLGWLAGSWSGTANGEESEEHWTAPKGGVMLGLHRDVKGGRVVAFEFLRIQETPEGLAYLAQPKGNPPTPFPLAESGPRRVVFANPKHDFPQRILYWLDADGALHARVEGPPGGKEVAMEWTWRPSRLH